MKYFSVYQFLFGDIFWQLLRSALIQFLWKNLNSFWEKPPNLCFWQVTLHYRNILGISQQWILNVFFSGVGVTMKQNWWQHVIWISFCFLIEPLKLLDFTWPVGVGWTSFRVSCSIAWVRDLTKLSSILLQVPVWRHARRLSGLHHSVRRWRHRSRHRRRHSTRCCRLWSTFDATWWRSERRPWRRRRRRRLGTPPARR